MVNWLERLIGETQARVMGLMRRSHQTINSLAGQLQLTDNAIRNHVAALGRDGLVESVGIERDTGGKPARVYALTPGGEELFPKGYAQVLGALLREMHAIDGKDHSLEVLQAVGIRVAQSQPMEGTLLARVEGASALLHDLGAVLDIEPTPDGWRLQGYACPLSAVVADHPELCEMARSLVAERTGCSVREACQRGERSRCAFEITRAA